MAKTSFAAPAPIAAETSPSTVHEADAISAAENNQSAAAAASESSPATQSPRALALPENAALQVQGEISMKDLKLPRINLVAKTGTLCDTFTPGGFVIAKECPLGDGKTPFKMVVVTIKKQYQEDLPYDPSASKFPQIFDKAAEVRAVGGSLQWGDEGYYKEIATALVLVPCPADIPEELRDQHFLYEVDGQHWALALWTLAGGAYTTTGKKIMTAGMIGHLKTGFARGLWDITSELKRNGANSWFSPVAKPAGSTSPEFQAFVAELLAQGL